MVSGFNLVVRSREKSPPTPQKKEERKRERERERERERRESMYFFGAKVLHDLPKSNKIFAEYNID